MKNWGIIATVAISLVIFIGCKTMTPEEKAKQKQEQQEYVAKVTSGIEKLKIGMSIEESNEFMPDKLNASVLLEKVNECRSSGSREKLTSPKTTEFINFEFDPSGVSVHIRKHGVEFFLKFDANGKLKALPRNLRARQGKKGT